MDVVSTQLAQSVGRVLCKTVRVIGFKMNNLHFERIRSNHRIWKALHELTDEKYEQWDSLTKEELVREVMKRTRGMFNPVYIRQLLDEI